MAINRRRLRKSTDTSSVGGNLTPPDNIPIPQLDTLPVSPPVDVPPLPTPPTPQLGAPQTYTGGTVQPQGVSYDSSVYPHDVGQYGADNPAQLDSTPLVSQAPQTPSVPQVPVASTPEQSVPTVPAIPTVDNASTSTPQTQTSNTTSAPAEGVPSKSTHVPPRVRNTTRGKNGRKSHRNHISTLQSNKYKASRNRVRYVMYALLTILVIIGAWNTFAPRNNYSAEDIAQIAKVSQGNTGYPITSGASIAQQFMQVYLESDGSDSSNNLLNTFYNGVSSTQSTQAQDGTQSFNSSTLTTPQSYKTVVKYTPTVFGSRAISATTGHYIIGAFVYRIDTRTGDTVKASNGTTQYRWLYYAVDVYYNTKTHAFSIFKNSPTRVAEPKTASVSSTPEATNPGDGEEIRELENDTMLKLLEQYFTAYASSDDTGLSVVTIKGESTPEATHGLDGTVELNGSASSAISYRIFGHPATDNYYRALVTVQWKEPLDSENAYTQTSTYVLKLKRSSGKFYVIDIQPFALVAQSNSSNS